MLLDKSNAVMLRLAAQYKDIPCDHGFSGVSLFSEGNIECLRKEGLLYVSRDGRYYRATLEGYDLLQHYGYDVRPDSYRESGEQVLNRREGCSRVVLTLLFAGIDVFASDVQELGDEGKYLSASTLRRLQRASGKNVAGNTSFTGLTGAGLTFYYVADPQDSLYFRYENKTLTTLLAQSRRNSPAGDGRSEGIRIVYMGADYPSLLSAVTSPVTTKATYRSAYDKFTMPVHLCPCNPDGAFQMRIMREPDYRKRLIETVLGEPSIPNPFYGGCDGTLDNEPFILAVDMDLRRITGMVRAARSVGVKAHIFARPCQCKALRTVLPDSNIRLYDVRDDEIKSVFSFSSFLVEPPIEPYITKEGEYIHDETIRACREARKANRKKGKASQKENEG